MRSQLEKNNQKHLNDVEVYNDGRWQRVFKDRHSEMSEKEEVHCDLDEIWIYVRLARDYPDLKSTIKAMYWIDDASSLSFAVEVKGESASVRSLVECWLLNKDALKEWLDTAWAEKAPTLWTI